MVFPLLEVIRKQEDTDLSKSNNNKSKASVFDLYGVPDMKQAFPLAMQHVVAMIVGCITPAIVVAAIAVSQGTIKPSDTVILIQAALLSAGLATIIQLFPIGKVIGSGLPAIMGVSFAYLATLQSIVSQFNIATVFGAQLVGGVISIVVGLFVKRLKPLFPPLVTGTVILTIGLSLYPTAANYMAGGAGSADYGSMKNWAVAVITLIAVTYFSHFCKGTLKLASILFGMIVGYVVAFFMGMVNFSEVGAAAWVQMPRPFYFGIKFEASAIISMALLFIINSIQVIGDMSAATVGGLDRDPSDKELSSGIIGTGVANMIGSIIGGLPISTFGQNAGIVATTKVVNRCVLGLAGGILLVAGFLPKFSSLLTTIPLCVLGGATASVFASITMTGIKLITKQKMSYRNNFIVGLAVALGMGITSVPEALALFPPSIIAIFGKSPVVLASLVAILLNVILPKDKEEAEQTSTAHN
jgi:xanthine permease